MAEDVRESYEPRSGTATWAGADSGTAQNVLTVRPEATVSVEGLLASYSGAGTTEATVELYDDTEGTAAADLTGKFDHFHLSPGDSIGPSDVHRDDVENDVVAVVSGNDAEVSLTVGGHVVTG